MRGASRRAGGMRVALTIVVAVLAVLAEPVSGATESLKDYKGDVTTSYAKLPNNQKNYIADDKVDNAAAIFADADLRPTRTWAGAVDRNKRRQAGSQTFILPLLQASKYIVFKHQGIKARNRYFGNA